jgi:hypothetical protein
MGISNNALRGASAIRRLPGIGHNWYLNSDFRKKFYGNLSVSNFFGFNNLMRNHDVGLTLSFQPLDALRISLSGNYSYNWRRQDQFVSNVNYNNSIRTIVSEVEQRTLRFTGRASFNITPDLTIQYYGQPYITRPLYSGFAYVTNALAKNSDDRFHVFNNNQVYHNNNEYHVDENLDGITDYRFSKPDFNFVQFRSNLVVRWEYKRGSELYLVWSQSNTPNTYGELDTPVFDSLIDNAFADQARNIFLIKWMYRFLR